MTTIDEIEKEILSGDLNNSPHRLAERKMELGGMYSRLVDLRLEIEKQKPTVMNALIDKFGKVNVAESKYNQSLDGQKLMEIEAKMRQIKSLKEGISSMLRVLGNEARNIM